MNYFACKKIEYILSHNAELDSQNEIVPKQGFSFISLSTIDKGNFVESSNKDEKDIYYEQNFSVSIKYDAVSEIQALHDQHFIIRLTKIDGSVFTWGSLLSLNPVQLEINTEKSVAELNFSRNSSIPEI